MPSHRYVLGKHFRSDAHIKVSQVQLTNTWVTLACILSESGEEEEASAVAFRATIDDEETRQTARNRENARDFFRLDASMAAEKEKLVGVG